DCNGDSLVPNSQVNRTFALSPAPFGNNPLDVTAFNLAHFTPIAEIDLSQFNGAGSNLIPWGNNGLAFLLRTGNFGDTFVQVVLLQGSLMLPPSTTKNPVPSMSALVPQSATHGGGNLRVSVQGSGFVPGATVTWNGLQRTVDFVSS